MGSEAAAEPEPRDAARPRPQVALASIPVSYVASDEGAEAVVPGTDLLLKLQDPPRPSYLALPERLVPDPRRHEPHKFPSIIAATDGSGTNGAEQALDVAKQSDEELASLRSQMEIKSQGFCSANVWELLPQTLHSKDPSSNGRVLQPPGARWVILNSLARISSVQENISFQWEAPPRVSTLIIDSAIIPEAQEQDLEPTVRIRSADPSGWLLLEATHGCGITLILSDAAKRSTARLPPHGRPTLNARSLGLIPDSRSGDHCMVAHLEPICGTDHATLLSYSTRTGVWDEKDAICSMLLPELWSNSGVISHAGKLWWFDLSNGHILSCDPFLRQPYLHRVCIPRCATATATLTCSEISRRTCFGLSDGKLRVVRLVGSPDSPTVIMSTLNCTEGQADTWVDDFAVPFLEIRADANYSWAELLRKTGPDAIAVIHPRDSGIVCFFDNFNRTACIYGVDMQKKCVIESQAVEVEQALHSSLGVLTWELPHALPGGMRSSSSAGCNNNDEPWSRIGKGLRGVLNFKQSGSSGLC